MSTQFWGFLCAAGAVYFCLVAMAAGKKVPKQEPRPEPKPTAPEIVIAWRFTLDADKNLDTLAVYMHPETEKYLSQDVWARLP